MLKAISRLIDFITWIISFLLIARFIMRFFGAGTSAPFIEWLYGTTADLMNPFIGVFQDIELQTGNLIDVAALVGAVIYVIIGYAFSTFLDSVADQLAYKIKRPEDQVLQSPNPVPPSVIQKPINQPIDPKN